MLYQLPDGRVINISVEEYLSMSDQELQNLAASNLGHYTISPWTNSAINKEKRSKFIDKSIDYSEESDEIEIPIIFNSATIAIITIDEIPLEEDDSQESEDT